MAATQRLFNRLIRPNAVIRIEIVTYTRDTSNGSVESWATLEDDVKVLVSGLSGSRDGRFGSQNNNLSGTISGQSANIARSDVRFFFKSATGNITPIVGVYGRVDSAAPHGATFTRLIPYQWYTAKWSQVRDV